MPMLVAARARPTNAAVVGGSPDGEGVGGAGRDREDDAQDGRDHGRATDLEELVGLDLQADGEEQDHDADLGEDGRRLAGEDEAERVGPHEQAPGQLADHPGLAQPPEDLLAHLGGEEEDEEPHDDVEGRGGADGRGRRGRGGRTGPRARRSGVIA